MAMINLQTIFPRLTRHATQLNCFNFVKNTSFPIITQLPYSEKIDCSTGNYISKRSISKKAKFKAPPTRVIDFSYTGDSLEGPSPLDLTLPRYGYEEAIKQIDDPKLRKRFTLEYADERERRNYREKVLLNRLRQDEDDTGSVEEKLTRCVIKMRSQMKHALKVRKDKQAEHKIRGRSNRMRETLIDLRQSDYERYEWLTQQYGIELVKRDPNWTRLTRRQKRINAAKEAFENTRLEKVAAIRAQIVEERAEFEKVKQAELEKVTRELSDLGMTLSSNLDDTLDSLGVKRILPKPLPYNQWRQKKFEKMMSRVFKARAAVRKIPEGSDVDLP